jgi:hypothetical protein
MPIFQDDPVVSKTSSNATVAITGQSEAAGIFGQGKTWHGVHGDSASTTGGFGVFGSGVGPGVGGVSQTWLGVYGETNGTANGPAGVWGEGKAGGFGVKGHASGPGAAGVAGFHLTNSGPGIFGKGSPAGHFEGDVEVTGDVRLINADCAEDFDVCEAEQIQPGTVVVLGEDGALRQSHRAYDKRVAGVVSGGGDYKPAIILDRRASGARTPVALVGKVFCKVDAQYGSIEVGDLLTSSPTHGHAMKVLDQTQAFGSVLGKALSPAKEGRVLIPILVALQ